MSMLCEPTRSLATEDRCGLGEHDTHFHTVHDPQIFQQPNVMDIF